MKKTFSKVISVALALMLTALMCITASAAELPGEGTKNSPYTISTAAELDAFSKAVADGNTFSGKFIALANDITVSSSFKPAGTAESPFRGTFKGNGNTISGINVNTDYAGLFAFTDGAVISDVAVSGSFSAKNYAGAVVAYAKDTVIEGCTADALLYADYYAGGIAGRIDSGKISSCQTDKFANISGFKEYCGGIAGYSAAEITACTNNAYIQGEKNVGGIAGYSAADIISCTNTAIVSAFKTNRGGIAGLISEAEIKYCSNTGKIANEVQTDNTAGNAGGIAGVAYKAKITECINSGEVAAYGTYAGGIAGYTTSTAITNCIASANVSASAEYAGGIFGFALNGETKNCVFTAVASAKKSTSAGIGAISQAAVSGCYYNNVNNRAVFSGTAKDTTALAAADFASAKNLAGLDFSSTWTMNTVHAAHPLLVNVPFHTLKISVSTNASCTKDGEFRGTCTLCKEEIVQITPAYGHSHMTVSSQEPTCTAAGYKDVLCTVCSETDSIILPATGHTDADGNNSCDVCKADITVVKPDSEKTFFEKLADFFNGILEHIKAFFENLFSK